MERTDSDEEKHTNADVEKPKTEKDPLILSHRSIENSLNRTKNNIYGLTKSNKWDLFITLTFDAQKVDRTDYDLLLKKLQNWLKGLKQSGKCPNLKYLIVPEIHKRIESNGKHAWHFHGLLANVEGLNIQPSYRRDGKRRITKSGLERYEIKDYKLGFSDATFVSDTFRVSTYILKYITKAECCVASGKRRFIYSQNLNKPIEEYYYSEHKALFEEYTNCADYITQKSCNVGKFNQTVTYYHLTN